MKKTVASIAVVAAFSTLALPAFAGPDWQVIHEAQKAHHQQHENAQKEASTTMHNMILPLDHGPRALSTPWVNKEEELAAKADKKTSMLASHLIDAHAARA